MILKDDGLEPVWKRLSTNIMSTAEDALGKRKVNQNGKLKRKLWFTQENKSLVGYKRKTDI